MRAERGRDLEPSLLINGCRCVPTQHLLQSLESQQFTDLATFGHFNLLTLHKRVKKEKGLTNLDVAAGFMPAFKIPSKKALVAFERGLEASGYAMAAALVPPNARRFGARSVMLTRLI